MEQRRDRNRDRTPQDQTARVLVEFLEIAINSIVFLKGIYPSGAFQRQRYMNVVVQKARNPQLNDYIHSTVKGLQSFIEKGLVERVAVTFSNTNTKNSFPTESFVFKLSVNQKQKQFQCDVEEEINKLELSLREFLVKLSLMSEKPIVVDGDKDFSKDCRWEIMGYFRVLPEASGNGNGSKEAEFWVPTETQQWNHPPLITPIKSMSSEPLSVQLYLEQPPLPQ